MERKCKVPRREAIAVVLLAAALASMAGRQRGWLVALCCFAGGAILPLSYTVVLLRERRLFLTAEADIERNRERIATARALGWILGAPLVAAGVGLGGAANAVVMATVAGLAFGFWPGLLANFLRLRREHRWG